MAIDNVGTRVAFSLLGGLLGAAVGFLGSNAYESANSVYGSIPVFRYWMAVCISVFAVMEFLTKGELIRSVVSAVIGIFGLETSLYHYKNDRFPTKILYVAVLAVALVWFTTPLVLR